METLTALRRLIVLLACAILASGSPALGAVFPKEFKETKGEFNTHLEWRAAERSRSEGGVVREEIAHWRVERLPEGGEWEEQAEVSAANEAWWINGPPPTSTIFRIWAVVKEHVIEESGLTSGECAETETPCLADPQTPGTASLFWKVPETGKLVRWYLERQNPGSSTWERSAEPELGTVPGARKWWVFGVQPGTKFRVWPEYKSEFATSCAPSVCFGGRQFRFDGFNMYYLNSLNNCGPTYSAPEVETSLADQAGGEGFRAWFFEHEMASGGGLNWAPFDQTLSIAARKGFKVIVTLENQWKDCVASGYKARSWYETRYKEATADGPLSYREYVKAIVTRYANNPAILGWQMINEGEADNSEGGTCEESAANNAMKAFAEDVGGLIRSIDPHHLVSLGTLGTGQCGASGGDYKKLHEVPNVDLCEYHDYGAPATPMPGDAFNGLEVRLKQCSELGKPLFVGETGITVAEAVPATEQQRRIDFDNKFSAQFGAGVAGELIWSWNLSGSNSGFDIGPKDPTVSLLTRY